MTPPDLEPLDSSGRRRQAFHWCVGIEDTAIGGPLRDGGRSLDEYELTGHYGRWQQDLELVADLGCNSIRYGIPWYRVNPERGRWDWSWVDTAIAYARELGLTVIADLIHYGTPHWLTGSFTDPDYPRAVAEYSAAVAARYTGLIDHFTPLNEPLITASFCGARAVWPPYERGDTGWARVAVSVADGLQRATRAIRAANPAATIAHVEAGGLWRTDDATLQDHAALLNLRKYLPTDLLTGAVVPDHPLHRWLLDKGIAAGTLDRLHRCAERPDSIGVNYYPTLSGRELVCHNGAVIEVIDQTGTAGLRTVLSGYHRRYGLPVWLSETALDGTAAHHIAWLRDSVQAVDGLRREGIPVIGYTWWPLFDFVDWSWASGGRVVEEFHIRGDDGAIRPVVPPPISIDVRKYLRRMGLYRLTAAQHAFETSATAAADAYRSATRTRLSPVSASVSDSTITAQLASVTSRSTSVGSAGIWNERR